MKKAIVLSLLAVIILIPFAFAFSTMSIDKVSKPQVGGGSSFTPSSPSKSGGGGCITQLAENGQPKDILLPPRVGNAKAVFNFEDMPMIYKGYREVARDDNYVWREFVIDGRFCNSLDNNGKITRLADRLDQVKTSTEISGLLPSNWWSSRHQIN